MALNINDTQNPSNERKSEKELERYGVWIKTGPKDIPEISSSKLENALDDDIFSQEMPDFSFLESEELITDDIIDDSPHSSAAAFSTSKSNAITPDNTDKEQTEAKHETGSFFDEPMDSFDLFEEEIDLDESLFEDETTTANKPVVQEEFLDISDFMDEETPPIKTQEDELPDSMDDDFLADLNKEFSGKKTQQTIMEDSQPLEIDLNFDDDFVSNLDSIDNTNVKKTVSTHEYEVQFENIESQDFETENFESMDIDSFMSDASDTPPNKTDDSLNDFQINSSTEFDDILLDLNNDSPIQEKTKADKKENAIYDLQVDVDNIESSTTHNKTLQKDGEQDEEVALFDNHTFSRLELDKTDETSYNLENIAEGGEQMNFEDLTTENEQIETISEIQAGFSSPENTNLLTKIADELHQLRNEITELKSEFSKLKNLGIVEENTTPVESVDSMELSQLTDELDLDSSIDDLPKHDEILPHTENQSTGFFSEDVEDETIALSGDELNNILNSADFTEEIVETAIEPLSFEFDAAFTQDTSFDTETQESVDETSDGLSDIDDSFFDPEEAAPAIDFTEPPLEEPELDNITFEEEEYELPAEIIISKPEDILVDSSDDDFISDDKTIAESLTEKKIEYLEEEPPLEELIDEAAESNIITTTYVTETIPKKEVVLEDQIDAKKHSTFDDQIIDEFSETTYEEVLTESTTLESELTEESVFDNEIVLEDPIVDFTEEEITDEPVFDETTFENESVFDSSALDDQPVFQEESIFKNEFILEDEFPTSEKTEDSEEDEKEEIQASPNIFASNQWREEPAIPAEKPIIKEERQRPIVDVVDNDTSVSNLPSDLKNEIKAVLSYMDQLLENLPEDKIEEFAKSEHFEVYKKLFKELGLS